jgi:maltose O-acetyltransferase
MNKTKVLNRFDDKILRILPGQTTMKIRMRLLSECGARLGDNIFIGQGVRVLNPAGLIIESNVNISRDTVLDARGGLILRSGCLVGFESILLTRTHNSGVPGIPVQEQGMFERPIEVENNVWIGARVMIMPGVTITANSIVGAGALVTKSIPKTGIYGGVPAKRISER